MKALRIHTWRSAPRLDEIDVPEPSMGETLVRIEAAGLSHFDLTVASGEFDIRPDLPYVPGVDGAGIVLQSDVWAPGSRVAIRGGGVGIDRPGTWAEYVVVPDEALAGVSEDLDLELAAVAYDPLTTAFVTLNSVSALGSWISAGVTSTQDEIVLVTGAAGAVGSTVVQLAARAGARVIGLVSNPGRVNFVPSVADVLRADDPETIAHLASGQCVTLLVDTVGGPGLAGRLAWVRPGGRAAVVGYTAGTQAALDLPNWLMSDVSVLPVNMLRRSKEGDAAADELLDLLVDGSLTLAHESFAMDRATDALESLAAGRIRGKAVLLPKIR